MLTRLEQFTAVAILLGLAVFFRLPQLTKEWPFRFCHQVQLTSALAARNLWLTHYKKDLTPEESKWLELKVGRFVEPPVLQHLAAATYAVVGEEVPWVAGLYGGLFWILGGLFLFRIARRVVGDLLGAIAALGFYYLTPYAILLSVSFQPEALLVLGFLISLDFLLTHPLSQSWKNTLLVSMTCGLLALAKPGLSLIPIFTVCFALNSWGNKDRFYKSAKQMFFFLLVPLPSIAYMVWFRLSSPFALFNIADDEFLSSHLTLDYLKHFTLLPTIPTYINHVVGFAAFGFALCSTILWGNSLQRRIYFGLLAGYLGNLLFFVHALGDFKSYGILASYYHWPLIPLTAIGIAAGAKAMASCLNGAALTFSHRILFGAIAVRVAAALALPALNTSSISGISDPTLYPLINSRIPRGERAIVFSQNMAQDVRFYSWLQTQSWSQEMQFLKLLAEGKLVELEVNVRAIVEKAAVPYLVIVVDPSRSHIVDLAKRFDRLPKILNTPSLVIYDVRSWIPHQELRMGASAEIPTEASYL